MSTNLCPHCGQAHRTGARFCSATGKLIPSEPLASAAPASGAANPVGSREWAAGLTGKLPPNALLKDRFLVVRKVGQGGMAAVYQAADTWNPGTPWAIKEMSDAALAAQDRDFAVQSFLTEAQLLRNLRHPNLPQVVDAFTDGGKHYLVMEFVQGRTLQELLQERREPFNEREVTSWAAQLCDVLTYLHSQEPKIIFRDMKPSNVMVTPEDRIKLVDFGIARFFKPGKTTDTMALGTPGYAAPEAISGQTDERSDIYSLCITLHQLLTLFDPQREMFNAPLLRKLNPTVSMQMERIVMRGIQNQREQRWQTAAELRAELSFLERVAGRPVAPVVQPAPGQASFAQARSSAPVMPQEAQPKPYAPVPPTQQAGYGSAGAPLAPTARAGGMTNRPTTRLLMAAKQLSGRQLAALAAGTLVLIVVATVLLAPILDDLDFNWNDLPIVAVFGALGYAAYPRRGVTFISNTLFSLVLVGTIWLTLGSQGYTWPNLILGALVSGAVMEAWVAVLPRLKRGATDAWQREVLWLSAMAVIGSILFYWIVSAGVIEVTFLPVIAAAVFGAAGWFVGDLLQQYLVQRSDGLRNHR